MNNVAQNPEYRIERLGIANLPDVGNLHTAVYNRAPPPGFFFLKYSTGFTGVNYIGFLAYNNQDIPVAFYGVIPCFIRTEDKLVLSAQSADTMTHPQYRYKGLFVELANMTFDLCREEGIELVFGFPNQNSMSGAINKLGYQMTHAMDCFIIKAAVYPWGKIFNKTAFLKRLYTKYQHNQIKKYLLPQNGIQNSVIGDHYAGIERDHDFLAYKIYTESRVIEINNSLLWIKVSNVLLIGDIKVVPADFEELMNKVKKLAKKLIISEVHFHASPGTTLHKLFAAHFNSIPSFPVLFKVLGTGIPIDKIKFTSADIDTF